MGQLVDKISEGVKYYDVFDKSTFNEVFRLQNTMTLYSFEPQEGFRHFERYFDTPGDLLARAGITLCKVVEKDSCFYRIERQNYMPSLSTIKIRKEQVFIEPAKENDKIIDHKFALIDGINSMFSTLLSFNFEDVFKNLVVKMEIKTSANLIKVLRGNGFKAEMTFENVEYINHSTKRSALQLMTKVAMTSPANFISSFEDFTGKLEKYCKKLIPVNESKYQMGIARTKMIEKIVSTTEIKKVDKK